MNELDRMTLEKDRLTLRLIKDDELKVTFENDQAIVWLRHWKSRKWKKLQDSEEKAGYIVHNIYRFGKRIRIRQHRLVWIYLHRRIPPPGCAIHHKDENKKNNHISNLELRTREGHLMHSGKYPNQKLTNEQRQQLIREYMLISGKLGANRKGEVQALADKYGIHRAHLAKIIRKHRKEQAV